MLPDKANMSKFDLILLRIKSLVDFFGTVFVVMYFTGKIPYVTYYVLLFTISFFLQAYIRRDNDAVYKRSMIMGVLSTILMIVTY